MSWKHGAMGVSAAGLLAIAMFEGFSGTAYQPLPGDAWTIGYGHTKGVQPGDQVTREEALGLLGQDTRAAAAAVNRFVEIPLEQFEFDALVSLAYNIGEDAFRRSTLLRCLNRSDRACVSREWVKWKYFKGQPVKGLLDRRVQELAIFLGGKPRLDGVGLQSGPDGAGSVPGIGVSGRSQ